ncbi:MAG TPA: hypothetical protein VKT77_05160 [Chthonomonadaceae bacterium]|nr:hypothetical protein [Chthonomonadaceae bacterium]
MQDPSCAAAPQALAIPGPARAARRFAAHCLSAFTVAALLSACALSRPAAAQGAAGKIVFESSEATGASSGSRSRIGVMNADGSNPITLTNTAKSHFDDWNPAFNRTGSKIAFLSDRTSVDEIYVMNSDGSNQVQISKNSSSKQVMAFSQPVFSPDGSKIAYSAIAIGVPNAVWDIYVMNADGSFVTKVTNSVPGTGGDLSAVFTPDGAKIVFEQTNPAINGFNLCKMDPSGSDQVVLASLPGSSSGPTISPDGSKIVVMANWQFILMNADGSGQTVIMSDPTAGDPVFSPDGTRLAFAKADATGTEETFTVSLDGSGLTQLTFGPGISPPSSIEGNAPGNWVTGSAGAPALASLTLSPSTVQPGGGTQGTVTISPAAPAGGISVALSGSSSVAVPAGITIPAGATSASFPIGAASVTSLTIATVTAAFDGASVSATLQINPAVQGDTVTVTQAEYTVSQKQLRVQATSTSASATLTVYDAATGATIGTMAIAGGGKYQLQTTWPTAPQSITVKSSLGGSATLGVTLK